MGSQHPQVPIRLNGVCTWALVDTGASISVVTTALVRENQWETIPQSLSIGSAFASHTVQSSSSLEGYLECGAENLVWSFPVVDLAISGTPVILGWDLLPALGISLVGLPAQFPGLSFDDGTLVPEANSEALQEPAEEVTAEELSRAMAVWEPLLYSNRAISARSRITWPNATLHIDTGIAEPINIRQYPLKESVHTVIDQRVAEWLKDGVIEITTKARWAFPIVVAAKKDQDGKKTKFRVCLDLRRLNQVIQGDAYPIPRITDVFRNFRNAKYFTTLDMADGYHQIAIDPMDREKISFIWRGVQYQYTCACFGLKTMTAIFQRLMSQAFADMPEVEVYVDDLTIASETLIQHIDRVAEVLSRLNKGNVRLRIEKCRLLSSWARSLGHLITRRGRQMDPRKVQAIVEWPLPRTVSELLTFLGTTSWNREYSPRYAQLEAPLNYLRTIKGPICWTAELLEAFQGIQDLFAHGIGILYFPDFSQMFYLFVDASQTGLGAYLAQKPTGKEQMISCASRSLTTAEQNYSTTKRELLGLIWAIRKFREYLACHKFVVYTDHRSLTFLLTQKHVMPMLNTWVDELMQYDFIVHHIPGKMNTIADSFSRRYQKWLDGSSFGTIPDGRIAGIRRLIQTEEIRQKSQPADPDLRKQILDRAHNLGHASVHSMYQTIWNQGYWWPDLRTDLDRLLQNCDQCQRHNVAKEGWHPLQAIIAEMPMDHIGMDLITPLPETSDGYRHLLVVMCLFTKFVWLIPCKLKGKTEVAQGLWKIFTLFGFPKTIQSDQGGEFVNDVMTEMQSLFGMEQRLVAAYNHHANGAVERTNRIIREMLNKHLTGATTSWIAWVPHVQFSHNSKIAALTGCTPFSLMFGRNASPFGHKFTSLEPTQDDLSVWESHLQRLHSAIYPGIVDCIRLKKSQMVGFHAKKHKIIGEIPNGTIVFAKDPTRSSKMDARYEGPFILVGRDNRGTYVLRDQTGEILSRHVSADQLKVVRRNMDNEPVIDSDFVEVENILDHKIDGNHYRYLVHWKNRDSQFDEWVKDTDFTDQQCIKDYWNRLGQSVPDRPVWGEVVVNNALRRSDRLKNTT